MAINNVKDTQSLLVDIEDWMNNPKFQPQEQNKWFFGEGLSYYTQLCEVVKVLTYLQENFKVVIANEKSLEQAYNEVKDLPSQFNTLSTKVDDLTNTVSDLPTRVQELETKVTKLISDVSSQLTRIETLEGSVGTNTNDIATIKTDIANIKTKDSQQDEKITTLEGKDFLTNVRLENSNSVTFQGGKKVDGVQTYSAQVVGSVPVNLGENVAYASNNNTSILTNINSNVNINSPDTNNYYELVKTINIIRNGELIEENIPIGYFNKKYFSNNENIFSLNINNIISSALLVDGSSSLSNYSPVINDLNTGIACGYHTENLPVQNSDTLILSGGIKQAVHIQVAFNAQKIFFRVSSDGVTWNSWSEYYIDKQDRLTFTSTDFNVTDNKVSLNPTKFTDYLLKSDAPGYADILTKTEASGEYETKDNASTIYETKQHASATYETKANATATYETKANASSTYVSKTEAVGYDDILTTANASTMYETKAHATETYETKSNASATFLTSEQANNAYANKNIEIYAESEKLIGTFMGHNLYRKLVKYSGDFKNGITNIPHNVTSLVRCIKCFGFRKSDNTQLPYINSSETLNIEKVDGTNIVVHCGGSNWGVSLWYFIIEYTKENEA